jgi:hypothetical protein
VVLCSLYAVCGAARGGNADKEREQGDNINKVSLPMLDFSDFEIVAFYVSQLQVSAVPD